VVAGKKSKIIEKVQQNLVCSNVLKVFCVVQTFVLSTKGNKNIIVLLAGFYTLRKRGSNFEQKNSSGIIRWSVFRA